MVATHVRHALFALVLMTPAQAAAQKGPDNAQQARAKAQEGLKLYNAERFQEAYATFREADALFHAPSLTLYVARCQRKLGKMLEARATYEQILAEDLPKDAAPAFVAAHVDAGKELAVLKQHMPSLRVVVTGVPREEAQATLNGAPMAEEQKDLDPGSYTIEVKARDAAPFTRVVALAEDGHETVNAALSMSTEARSAEASSARRIGAYVSFGLGGAGGIAGGVLGGLALSAAGQVKTLCHSDPKCGGVAGATDKSSQAYGMAWGANVGIGVAVAGVVTGVVLLVVGGKSKEPAAVGIDGVTLHF
jgi:hypothetical protein